MANLVERIDAALNGKPMKYYDLACVLFPDPDAWRKPTRGGPPGCYIALSAAIRRGNFAVTYEGKFGGTSFRTIHPRKTP